MSYQPIKAVRFKVALARAMTHLGAVTSDSPHYDSVLCTRAGPMHCNILDTALCAWFQQPQDAQALLKQGKFEAGTGKWSWHVRRPDDPEDAREVFLALSRLLPAVAEGRVGIDLPERSPAHSNTRITYMYRDGANYKTSRAVVVAGALTPDQAAALLRCCEEAGDFIPGQIGLPDLQDSFQGCESHWDPELDHPVHELTSIKLTTAQPTVLDPEAGQMLTTHDLVERFTDVVFAGGWDHEYLPEFHAQMAQRYERSMREAMREGISA